MISIRRRTLVLVLALFVFSNLLIFVVSARDATHEVKELFDARLVQGARLLHGLVRADPDFDEARRARLDAAFAEALDQYDADDGHRYESMLSFQVWRGDTLLMRSAGAPERALSAIGRGFVDAHVGEHIWRVYVLYDSVRDLRVLVGEPEEARDELINAIVWQTLIPDLIGGPLLAVLIWSAIGWGLRPLDRMARLIRAREPASLQPLELSPLPEELAPMQQALNRLLGEVARLLESEQRFLADAAHELRTPLAVLRVHAQNALDAPDAETREEALRELRGGVDRITRLATQLLTLARLETAGGGAARQPVDLLAETRRVLAELMPLVLDAQVDLALEADERMDWQACLEPGALDMLVHNLVGNAVRHAARGQNVEVALLEADGGVELRVADHGPGVSAELRTRLAERFLRTGPAAGSGLGLSIVRRVAERHGGTLDFVETPGGGLTARVCLPRAETLAGSR
ncbi:two-component sensor histidine kinase [Pseudothauera nasutitermitis]|uniref:histidine kinase n=1 Tax=Pseudothauera nasutitermitis TaxID=2565930 RepID=A0A4S4AT66_9RHOO|nr:ATP-binding protein [Pseudothauera nasutitermitis]THF63042.1 two-component sensor histidine kinase [Pseudothauera nasutitermitis]